MMEGDLEVMDRLVRLTGEPDRYHGFARPGLAAATEATSPGVSASPASGEAPVGSRGETFPACKPLKSLKMELESADCSVRAASLETDMRSASSAPRRRPPGHARRRSAGRSLRRKPDSSGFIPRVGRGRCELATTIQLGRRPL
jgi:hypothetical protein